MPLRPLIPADSIHAAFSDRQACCLQYSLWLDDHSTADILRDNFYNACFMRPNAQFVCLDPTPGANKFTLVNGRTALAHDGITGFKACPNTGGGELVWGSGKANAASCRAIQLKPEGFKGTC